MPLIKGHYSGANVRKNDAKMNAYIKFGEI